MATRNFWIEADIDGRKTELAGGPRRKDGGFVMNIYMRNEGGIDRPIDIEGIAKSDGSLMLRVTDKENNKEIFRKETDR